MTGGRALGVRAAPVYPASIQMTKRFKCFTGFKMIGGETAGFLMVIIMDAHFALFNCESTSNLHHQCHHRLFCYIFVMFLLYVDARFLRQPRRLEDNIHPFYFRGNNVQQLIFDRIIHGIFIYSLIKLTSVYALQDTN